MRGAALALLLAACGDDCKPAPFDAGPRGATASAGGQTFVYGDFDWSPNRDCGFDSISIDGVQVEPTVATTGMTFCVPDPASLGSAPVPLADDTKFIIIDVFAHDGPCTLSIDHDAVPSGTVALVGFCEGARHTVNLTLDGSVAGFRTCDGDGGQTQTPITLDLSGTVAVRPPP